MISRNLLKAFADAQSEFTTVCKDKQNPYFKSNYATFDAIVSMLRPILAKHGLCWTQSVERGEMVTRIFGKEPGVVRSAIPFTCDSKKPQEIGSAITYAKRYGLQCAFGVVVADDPTDDDGEAVRAGAAKMPPPMPPMPR